MSRLKKRSWLLFLPRFVQTFTTPCKSSLYAISTIASEAILVIAFKTFQSQHHTNPQEESFVKSVKALTLLYDGEISEDIIPASTSVLVDTVIDTDPVVIDTPVVDTTDTTARDTVSTASDSAAPATVTRTVVEVSGESGEMIQQLNDQVFSDLLQFCRSEDWRNSREILERFSVY